MPRKKVRKSKSSRTADTFGERMKQFGEEAGALGKKVGKKGEELGKRAENTRMCGGCCGGSGAAGLVLSVIMGILGLAVSIWALDFLARKTASPVLSAMHGFLFENIGIFILIFLASSLFTYLSRCSSRAGLIISPFGTAFGATVFFWVAANVMLIANIDIGSAAASATANFILNNLAGIFWLFLIIGYLVLLLKLLFGLSEGCCPGAAVQTPPSKPHKIPAGGPKRLYRSGKEKVIAGVCGGIAEYLGVDPVVIRLLWVALILAGGSGVLLYIIAWIVIPRNPEHEWKD